MKVLNRIFIILSMMAAATACIDQPEVMFGIDTSDIVVGPEGGIRTISISSSESWVASTQQPWITVSPANGKGSTECKIIIDSTLNWNDERVGSVLITPEKSEGQSFDVRQAGFEYMIALDESQKQISEYAEYGKRSFQVKVKTNVDFKVVVPDAAQNWLKVKKPALNLDRKARPREIVLTFDWQINSIPSERKAEVRFEPLSSVAMGRNDVFTVTQSAAAPIPEGTVEGDSLALLALNRSLGVWSEYDTAERMRDWNGITVWNTKDERNGRVRSAEFAAFTTKEGLPYEVQYLTAAEELFFYGNTNTFLLGDLDCGPYICQLPQLRRLTIGAYGLNALHPDFKNLKNLEYLNLESNNFQKIPEIINEQNFEKLTALILNANIRYTVLDLSNEIRENLGGFIEEEGFPTRFLMWDRLDTLRLSANYLQGELPSDEEIERIFARKGREVEYWSNSDKNIKDSIDVSNVFFEKNRIPKVLPETDFLAINLNRFYGKLPNWILYHPKLDLWYPDLLIWSQEGKAQNGTRARFDNAPTNLNYYYDIYTNKKYNSKNDTEE